MPSRTALFLALFLLTPTVVTAQIVRGEMVEEETGAPIDGALVVLVDEHGTQHAGSLSNVGGRFELRAPAAGLYRLLAERIGYRGVVSELLRLGEDQVLEHRLTAPAAAIAIAGIEVRAQRHCFVRPEDGLIVATLWEEARKALNAAAWTERQGLVRFRAIRYEREIEPRTQRVTREQSRSWWGGTVSPFVSLPAAELIRDGYVRPSGDSILYYAPDAEVLLSSEFLDHYCFRVVDDRDGLIGVSFEPVGRRSMPDVQGVLWIDRASAELRRLEYGYTRVPSGSGSGRPGGEMEFQRLPTGAWIVQRWTIRMPQLAEETRRVGTTDIQRRVVTAIHEEGGEVVEIQSAGGARLTRSRRAVLEGVVFDSLGHAPLPDATVFLDGTSYSTTTDSEGRFRIEDLPAGLFHASFLHPRLDSLELHPQRRELELELGATLEVELAIPSRRGLLAARCAAQQHSLGTGAVVGFVVESQAGFPLSGIPVVVSWDGGRETVVTDAEGAYRLCVAPRGVPLSIEPRLPSGYTLLDEEEASRSVIGEAGVAYRDVAVRAGEAVALPGLTVTARSAREELRRTSGTRLDLFTREDLARLEITAHHVGDVVRRLPGVRVREVADGGIRSALCIESTRTAPIELPPPPCRPVKVYVDDMHMMDGAEFLVTLPINQIESVQYIPGVIALSRYGIGSEHGVLLIYSRGLGPTGRSPRQ